jgi:hypothetical protein
MITIITLTSTTDIIVAVSVIPIIAFLIIVSIIIATYLEAIIIITIIAIVVFFSIHAFNINHRRQSNLSNRISSPPRHPPHNTHHILIIPATTTMESQAAKATKEPTRIHAPVRIDHSRCKPRLHNSRCNNCL